MYELRLYSRTTGDSEETFAYILRKSCIYKNAQLAYLEDQVKKCKLRLICKEDFKCKDPSSRMLRIILETEYAPRIKEIDRRKVDEMSNGEKQVFTLPKNVRRLKAIVIDEEDRLLLTATPNERFSQSVSSYESRPGVEGDDTIELVHQYICMMLIVYTLYASTMTQPFLR